MLAKRYQVNTKSFPASLKKLSQQSFKSCQNSLPNRFNILQNPFPDPSRTLPKPLRKTDPQKGCQKDFADTFPGLHLGRVWALKIAPFKTFLKPSKFRSCFYIVFTRFEWPLGSQHGSQNLLKSTQNRCPCPSLSWGPLDIKFSSKNSSKVNKAEERRRHFRMGINAIFTLSAC